MSRNALAAFFERLVVATLPLAVPACTAHHDTPALTADMTASAPGGDDLAIAGDLMSVASVDLAVSLGVDLARSGDSGPPDPCDTNPTDPPPILVSFPPGSLPDGGFSTPCRSGGVCAQYCPYRYTTCCGPDPASDGTLQLTCILNCPAGPNPGRRPAGLQDAPGAPGCVVGQYFANAAHLEAASVHAFRVLGRELTAHGAPARLVAGARSALRDEVRHARLTRRVARAHGARPAPVRVAPPAVRSLEQIAVENAAEGCVRETFAALLAVWQARAAADPEVRHTMAALADDEIRHAQLAWDIDAWAAGRLDAAARQRVVAARMEAVAELEAAVSEPPAELVQRVGLPARERARQLVAATRQELWGRGRA
jgi:hypothetical protein